MIQQGMTAAQRRGLTLYRSIAALGVATLALACQSQADPSYRGEPLLSLTGQVEVGLSAVPVEVGILWLTLSGDFDLVCTGEVVTATGAASECVAACGEVSCGNLEDWGACAESCSDVTETYVYEQLPSDVLLTGGIGQTTPAVGEFPAQFSLDLLEPPPTEAILRSKAEKEQLAIGLFVALAPDGAPWRFDRDAPTQPPWLLGSSTSHLLVFSPKGISEGGSWADMLRFPVGAGYTLVELSYEDCGPDAEGCIYGQPVPAGDTSQVELVLASPGEVPLPLLDP